jgi:hypothetical protein
MACQDDVAHVVSCGFRPLRSRNLLFVELGKRLARFR